MTTTHQLQRAKRHALLVATVSAAILAIGCEKRDTTSKQLDRVEQKTAVVAHDMREYSYEQKQEFVGTMKTQLADLNRELDLLAAKVDKADAQLKADAQPRIKALHEQTAHLNKQLDKAQDATESTWESFKKDVKGAYDASAEGLHDARRWASEKIAP